MKKLTAIAVIAVLLCAAALVCISIGYNRKQAAEREALSQVENIPIGNTYPLNKATSYHDYVSAVSVALDPPYRDRYTEAGFTAEDITDSWIGFPFAIYVFDKQGQLIEDAVTVSCPIVTNGKYSGRVGIEYSETERRNLYEYHKDTLILDIAGGTVDTAAVLTLGRVGSKTFVTDGVNLDILAVDETPHPDDLTDDELKALAPTFKAAAGDTYNYICGYSVTMQPIE